MTLYVRAMVGLPSVLKLPPNSLSGPQRIAFLGGGVKDTLEGCYTTARHEIAVPEPEESMSHVKSLVVTALLLGLVAAARPAPAQTTQARRSA
jgi:hypothetical protein